MQVLKAHHSNLSQFETKVEYGLKGQRFWVKAVTSGPFYLNHEAQREGFENWKLWEHDVIELFLTREHPRNHYLELQVSPLNQKLALIVRQPRAEFDFYFPASFRSDSCIEHDLWRMECELDIADIPGASARIKGNINSCRGPQQRRCYFGLEVNPEERADFHRPELFLVLGELA